jgi:hypothetical protein
MLGTDSRRALPNADRVSVLAATILLAYALTRYVNLPPRELSTQLFGVYLSIPLNVQTVVSLLVAGLTAAGAYWLVLDHPAQHAQTPRRFLGVQHWLLPALTSWAIGVPLSQLPYDPIWWAGLAIGGTVLVLIWTAEYVVINPNDIRYPLAASWLSAVSFALYLILAIALRVGGFRLYLILPAMALGAGVVSLRTLNLRLHGEWPIIEAGLVTLIIGQFSAALHYIPLSPISFGLATLGPVYALINLIGSLADGKRLGQALLGPMITILIAWGSAWWIG